MGKAGGLLRESVSVISSAAQRRANVWAVWPVLGFEAKPGRVRRGRHSREHTPCETKEAQYWYKAVLNISARDNSYQFIEEKV